MEGTEAITWEVYNVGMRMFRKRWSLLKSKYPMVYEHLDNRVHTYLLNASIRHDPRGMSVWEYARNAVYFALSKGINSNRVNGFSDRNTVKGVHQKDFLVTGDDGRQYDPIDYYAVDTINCPQRSTMVRDCIERIKSMLPERSYKIIRMHYIDGKTLEEIGKELNLTRQRIQQIEDAAMQRVREKLPHLLDGE
jgi:RNA polymerase sigma factor (sigma-70 family)